VHTPVQAKRRIVGLGVVAVAVPAIGLAISLVIGHRPLALLSALFVVVMLVGSVRAGRASWQSYLDGPPSDRADAA